MSITKSDDIKASLINIFKACLNILRDNEGLTGEKALRNMSYLLILKMIEPHFGKEINIDDYEYGFSYLEDNLIEEHKNKLLYIVRFSNISKENDDDIPNLMNYLWSDILAVHPSTKNIYVKGKTFDIKRKSTYRKIIDKLNSLDFINTEYDVLGNAYEEVIQDIMTGKVLGQFFTPLSIKKMMIKLINPQIYKDGTIDTCCDLTMGTAGFLITYLKYILQQAKNKNIKPDWDFIKNDGLYGKELEPDTYQLAVSNMLISSGQMFDKLDRGDSIREPILRKFDNILANPPFGICGLRYDEFTSSIKNEYTPIKTDNAVSLFIQAIIYMLKINGKCAVVIPDGKDLFSKTNKAIVAVREYLCKTCDLQEIIYLPSGIFTYTNIKTCVFYFVKKRDGTDVLETTIKFSNGKKETGRDYKFTKTYQTTSVKFYEYNPQEDVKNLLVDVSIDTIANNKYSLNYTEYMTDNTQKKYENGVIIKTIGEFCKFLPKSKRNAKYGKSDGLYPFFKSSLKVNSYVDIPDYNDEAIIIGDGGEANINYSTKFSSSDHCYIIKNNDKSIINLKYIYYYLYNNMHLMADLYTGIGIKNISKSSIEKIKIPIPSLDRQQEIIDFYENNNKLIKKMEQDIKNIEADIINNKKLAQVFITDVITIKE